MNHQCVPCNRSFPTDQALRQHVLHSVAHKPVPPPVPYTGISYNKVMAVWTAVRAAVKGPNATVATVRGRVDTELSNEIIDELINDAIRGLPAQMRADFDNSRSTEFRNLEAQSAEDNFCSALARLGYNFRREHHQRGGRARATPDVLFDEPVTILGHMCHWIEYKSYFGFGKNPFIGDKELDQFEKYRRLLGSGIVIYKLGFQTEHVEIDGVLTFREEEFLRDLRILKKSGNLKVN